MWTSVKAEEKRYKQFEATKYRNIQKPPTLI